MEQLVDMSRADMKEMFQHSLIRTYEMLLGQIQKARRAGVKLKVCTRLLTSRHFLEY